MSATMTGLTLVPEYREAQRAWLRERQPELTAEELEHRLETKWTHYYVAADGVIYEQGDDRPQLLRPMDAPKDSDFLTLLPGHRFDSSAPIRCLRCGTDLLQVFGSGFYETSARCVTCGVTEVVHDG